MNRRAYVEPSIKVALSAASEGFVISYDDDTNLYYIVSKTQNYNTFNLSWPSDALNSYVQLSWVSNRNVLPNASDFDLMTSSRVGNISTITGVVLDEEQWLFSAWQVGQYISKLEMKYLTE